MNISERTVTHPLELDGIRHRHDCAVWQTPAFQVLRSRCNCGAAERERCAKIAENPGFIEARDTEWDEGVNFAKKFIAEKIRADQ